MSWIELVDATGSVVARRTVLGVPCTIGSAVDNTLVVEDPDVAPYHARIDREADGSLTVTVLGGSSGLHRPGAPERAMSLALTPSAAVAMGGSIIRLVNEATREVPASARPRGAPAFWLARLHRPAAGAVGRRGGPDGHRCRHRLLHHARLGAGAQRADRRRGAAGVGVRLGGHVGA